MTQESPQAQAATSQQNTSLPLKITGIVFWGMAAVGIFASWFLIKDYRENISEKARSGIDSTVLAVSQLLLQDPNAKLDSLKAKVREIRTANKITAISLLVNDQTLISGKYTSDCTKKEIFFYLSNHETNPVSMSVCLPDLDKMVSAYQKKMLLSMATLFISLGLLLQHILKSIISKPIMEMVNTAKAIHEGDSGARFNENWRDEFGFLSRFINQALDTTANKSAALTTAEQANSAKSLFLANMSHEIRTPLTAVLGFAETIRDDEMNKEQRLKNVDNILRNGKHLMQVINDILDLSKIEANQLTVESVDVNLIREMLYIDSLIGYRIRDKGLEFRIEYDFPLPDTIVTDPTRLRQILLNLFSNALKFTESGYIRLRVSYAEGSDHVLFEVSDSGIGMAREELVRLFQPFSQADESTTRKYGGTGLGLYISRELAMMLGGDLECTSTESVGSAFLASIKAGVTSQTQFVDALDPAQRERKTDETMAIPRLSGRILLAEDNIDNQTLVILHVRKCGADITVVENGKAAVEEALMNDYDLVLMDMQMPVMGGLEALMWLRNSGCETPVAMLTANAMKEEREKCLELKANEFLTKPIDRRLFYDCLAKYLPEADGNDAGALLDDDTFEARIKTMREKFLEGLPAKISTLRQNLAEEDWSGLQGEIHQLKGVGGGVGLPEITDRCRRIESEIRNHSHDSAKEEVLDFIDFCQTLVV